MRQNYLNEVLFLFCWQDVDQYFLNELRKEEEVVKVRLENIKLKNKLKKKEAALKSREELAEGLHMIDFEQLKIENQTYNEKIEERNEVWKFLHTTNLFISNLADDKSCIFWVVLFCRNFWNCERRSQALCKY